jgi:hypothetical protein
MYMEREEEEGNEKCCRRQKCEDSSLSSAIIFSTFICKKELNQRYKAQHSSREEARIAKSFSSPALDESGGKLFLRTLEHRSRISTGNRSEREN